MKLQKPPQKSKAHTHNILPPVIAVTVLATTASILTLACTTVPPKMPLFLQAKSNDREVYNNTKNIR